MIVPGLPAGLGGPVWAKFALIGASMSYALALMVARRLRGVPAPVMATGQLTASTLVMIPVVLAVEGGSGLFDASAGRLGGGPGARGRLDGLRLSPLFPHRRQSRRHQRLAGHPDRAGQRHPARHAVPRRAARTARDSGHGDHPRRTACHRRPAARPQPRRDEAKISPKISHRHEGCFVNLFNG